MRKLVAWWLAVKFPEDTPPAGLRAQRTLLIVVPIGAVLHLGFALGFALLGAELLVWFNLGFSVPAWLAVGWLVRTHRPRLGQCLLYLELLAHCVAATLVLGWASGFHAYALNIIASHALGEWGKAKWVGRAGFVVALATWTALFFVAQPLSPLVALPAGLLRVFNYVNLVTAVSVLSLQMLVESRAAGAAEAALAAEHRRAAELANAELRRQVAERSRALSVSLGESAPSAGLPDAGAVFDGRYRVLRLLGRGGMGVVYEVHRASDDRRFALKLMTGAASPEATQRFMREAEIAARLSDPHLVSVVDVGVAQGAPFLVMDLVDGCSLDALEARYGDDAFSLRVLGGIARGLATLHGAGVVHRDLKPGNVLVGPGTPPAVVKLTDFGIARFAEAEDPLASTLQRGASGPLSLTGTGYTMGTPMYMAPEVVRSAKTATSAVDIYAFGLFASEVLTRAFPFAQPPALEVAMGRQVPPPDLSALRRHGHAETLAPLVEACLSLDPAARPTAAQLAGAFANISRA